MTQTQSAEAYLQDRCQQWAEQTQESYRCPQHQQPNPFCHCVDVTGQRLNGEIVYDGKWEERGNKISDARRRYHVWAHEQRPEVQKNKEKFKRMIESKQEELQRFKTWQSQCVAAGFITVGYYNYNGR